MIAIFILLAIISLVLLLWQISNIISVFSGSPYVTADKKVISEALKLVKLKKGEVFYDLGCGNGDVLIAAAKMGAKATGFEISPFYYLLAKIRIIMWKIWKRVYHIFHWSAKDGIIFGKIKVKSCNIIDADLSGADIVYCYLLPGMLGKLRLKFEREMRKGSRVISVGFPIKALKNSTEYNINSRKIFIYKF